MSEWALEVRGASLRFGAVAALSDVSFQVRPGELFAVIGPNGAGKTSLFNLLSCIYPPTAGELVCLGRDMSKLKPHQLAGLGVARTFQNLALFPLLSVLENVLVGRSCHMRARAVRAGLGLPAARREERANRQAAREALDLCGIGGIAARPVGILPYGIRKRVELARAIAMEPKLLLLDEPVAGMSRAERAETAELIRSVHSEIGCAVVLVEHDMNVVMTLAERVLVLDFGRTVACGPPSEIQSDPQVIRAYLGEPEPDEDADADADAQAAREDALT